MYSNAEVFISYSRRLPGPEPDAAAGAEEVGRWRARTVAVDLVGILERRLKESYEVWRDEPRLTPGDELGRELDAALLSCAGAVILLDTEALDRSSWVWWETTILTWRRRITPEIRVVPVLIDVDPELLKGEEYGASRVGELLAIKVATATVTPGSATYEDALAGIAGQVVSALGELEPTAGGPVGRWMAAVASCLPSDSARWRPFLVDAFRPYGQRLQLAQDPAGVVARELLSADQRRFKRILNAFDGFPFVAAETLMTNLEPVWVKPDVGTKVAEVRDKPPGARILAVNALEPRTGELVVRRGLAASYPQRLSWTPAATTVEGAIADAVAEIDKKWAAPDEDVEDLSGCFVVMSCGAVPFDDLARIARALASQYPSLTYVLMAGDASTEGVELLEPALPKEADELAHRFQRVLSELVMGQPTDGG